MKSGIHLMHKLVGPTSFSLVQACIESVRRDVPHRRARVCHGGTLDPFASGLLLMLVGPATRLFDYLHAIPKTYEATIRWGIETDNSDPHGRVTFTGDASALSPTRLDEALRAFVGWHEQIPPSTSAKRIDGVRAYVRAHRGENVVMPPTRVFLHDATWIEHDLSQHQSRVRLVARGGYYVRALARDLGRLIGCGAHIGVLHRTKIGPWEDPGADRTVHVSGRGLLPWASSCELTDQEVGELRRERPIGHGEVRAPDWSLPDGFPDPGAPIRGIHRDRLTFLLKEQDEQLVSLDEFRGGI